MPPRKLNTHFAMKRPLTVLVRTLVAVLIFLIIYCLIKNYQRCNLLNSFRLTSSFSEGSVKESCRPWFRWANAYRTCLLGYLEAKGKNRTAWRYMHEAVATCSGQSAFDMMDVKYLRNMDDVKLVIMPSNIHSTCTEVTLGIGNDTGSEEQLLKLLPHCRTYGADPLVQVGKIFETIGKYFEVAVGARNGVFNASVLVGPGIWDYATKEVPTISFSEFLRDMVKSNRIDYLFMDNEGAEYEILPLFNRGSAIEATDTVVCQVSVELHGPLTNYGMDQLSYNDMFFDMIKQSPLIPFWAAQPARHARMFLLNADHNYCVQKFLYQWCTVK